MLAGKAPAPVEILPQGSGKTRDIVARTIGLGSGKQWDKLEYVAQNKPTLLKDIKPDGISLSRAYIETRKGVAQTKGADTPLPQGIFKVLYIAPLPQSAISALSPTANPIVV